jgi:membrane protein CcdC involved in cytochrome C biogenesis
MIVALVLLLLAGFLAWLGATVDEPGLSGLFWFGALMFTGCAITWYLDARRLRNSRRLRGES